MRYRIGIVVLAVILSARMVLAEDMPKLIFSFESWTIQTAWNGDASRIIACTYDPKLFATNPTQYYVTVYDAGTGQALFSTPSSYPYPGSSFPCFVQSADQNLFLNMFENHVQLWDVNSGKMVFDLDHTAKVMMAWWSTDESRILALTADGQMNLWDMSSGQRLQTRDSELVFVPSSFDRQWFINGNALVVWGLNDNHVAVWDVMTGERLRQWVVTPPDGLVFYSASVSADGRRALFGFYIGTAMPSLFPARVMDVTTGEALFDFDQPSPVTSAIWIGGSHRFITQTAGGGTSDLWDADTGKRLSRLEMQYGPGFKSIWSPDGSQLAAGAQDLRVWKADGTLVLNLPFEHHELTGIVGGQWSADGRRMLLVTGTRVRVIDIPSGKETKIVDGVDGSLYQGGVWSKDNRRILAWSGAHIDIWDTPQAD